MPIIYEVDEARNFIHVKLTGKITEDDLLKHANQFLADPRIKPGYRELFDAIGAVPDGLSSPVIDQILENERQQEEKVTGSKIALVISDQVAWGFAKEYERQAMGSVIVFYNLDVAKKWLAHDV